MSNNRFTQKPSNANMASSVYKQIGAPCILVDTYKYLHRSRKKNNLVIINSMKNAQFDLYIDFEFIINSTHTYKNSGGIN